MLTSGIPVWLKDTVSLLHSVHSSGRLLARLVSQSLYKQLCLKLTHNFHTCGNRSSHLNLFDLSITIQVGPRRMYHFLWNQIKGSSPHVSLNQHHIVPSAPAVLSHPPSRRKKEAPLAPSLSLVFVGTRGPSSISVTIAPYIHLYQETPWHQQILWRITFNSLAYSFKDWVHYHHGRTW